MKETPPFPWLYVIGGSGDVSGRSPWDALAAAGRAGAGLLQVRDRSLGDAEIVRAAGSLHRRGDRGRSWVLINDRFDLALAAGVDGVHLKSSGLPTAAVRARIGASMVLARSTHSPEEVGAAARDGVDFVVFGPVFATPSKRSFGPPQGLTRLERACREAEGVPVLAIGGIDASRARACMEAGASGVAVIRAVMASEDPGPAAESLCRAMGGSLDKETDT